MDSAIATKLCKCGAPRSGRGTRCRDCNAAYARARRAVEPAAPLEFAVFLVCNDDDTFSVLLKTKRGTGEERARLYGPYAERAVAQNKAELIDTALDVWRFAVADEDGV